MPATASSAVRAAWSWSSAAAVDVLEHHGEALADADADRRDAPALARSRAAPSASVPRIRPPEAPSGWPIAIAPPRALTISGSTFQASTQASDCTANASLSSTAPTSAQPMPARAQRAVGRLDRREAEVLRLQRGRRRARRSGPAGRRRSGRRRPREPSSTRGGAVVERRGVAGGDRAVGPERRLRARPASPAWLPGRMPSSRVRSTPCDRHDQVVVEAVVPGPVGEPVRARGELVLPLPGDAEPLAQLLVALAERDRPLRGHPRVDQPPAQRGGDGGHVAGRERPAPAWAAPTAPGSSTRRRRRRTTSASPVSISARAPSSRRPG